MAWEVVFVVVFVPFGAFILLMALMQWGDVWPRFGRWLNARVGHTRLGRAFPIKAKRR